METARQRQSLLASRRPTLPRVRRVLARLPLRHCLLCGRSFARFVRTRPGSPGAPRLPALRLARAPSAPRALPRHRGSAARGHSPPPFRRRGRAAPPPHGGRRARLHDRGPGAGARGRGDGHHRDRRGGRLVRCRAVPARPRARRRRPGRPARAAAGAPPRRVGRHPGSDHARDDRRGRHDGRPPERLRRFGQSDNVRVYGEDFFDRLRDADFVVSRMRPATGLGRLRPWRYGLDYRDPQIDRLPAAWEVYRVDAR